MGLVRESLPLSLNGVREEALEISGSQDFRGKKVTVRAHLSCVLEKKPRGQIGEERTKGGLKDIRPEREPGDGSQLFEGHGQDLGSYVERSDSLKDSEQKMTRLNSLLCKEKTTERNGSICPNRGHCNNFWQR